MSVQVAFELAEGLLLLILVLRMIGYSLKNKRLFITNFEIQLYVFIWILNILGHLYYGLKSMFIFYHATAPIAVILGILMTPKSGAIPVIGAITVLAVIQFNFANSYYYIALYFIAIYLLLRRSLDCLKNRNSELKMSSLYLVLSIDLLATMLALTLKQTNYNWEFSELLPYLHIGRLAVFTTTLIFLNVQFSRFFTP